MLKILEKTIRMCMSLVISGVLVACSGSNNNDNKIISRSESTSPTISKVTFCFRDGEPLIVNGSGFSENAGNSPNSTGLKVFICNSSTWNDSTACENQNYSSWSDNSIKVSVTLGKFSPESSGYLYVLDVAGDVNPNGYSITFCAI